MRTCLSICIAIFVLTVFPACGVQEAPTTPTPTITPIQKTATPGSASIRFTTPKISDDCSSIQIDGQIGIGDLDNLSKLISLNDQGCPDEEIEPGISFNSLGGDLDEAIAIGRLIREKQIATIIMPGAKCISACTIAFIGGVSRTVHGAYGIHRPYATSASSGPDQSLSQYNHMTNLLRSYMVEMRISPDLAEQMIKTSPDNVRFLTPHEMNSFGVIGKDPVWEDLLITKNARKYRISRQEYISRSAAVKTLCGKGFRPYPDQCAENVMKTGSAVAQ